ncbi:MAG: Formaldehyde dismutase [Deltaproteobacteria bacterium ADurb.Bin151]|nr:MAG: Formaldehyde dismutase [Deltaproteobacteria bacterium ADurb.Bin151]
MKAVVFRKAQGLVYEDVPDYKVAEDEVLVKVANTGFCGSDHSLVTGGLLPEGYIIGHEISGVVVEKGEREAPPWAQKFASDRHTAGNVQAASPVKNTSVVCTGGPRGLAIYRVGLPSTLRSIRRC